MTTSHSKLKKCPRCNHDLTHIQDNTLDHQLCENCGWYKIKGQDETISYGIIVIDTKRKKSFIPVINQEDIPNLKKAIIGKKKLRVYYNGKIKVTNI